MLVLWESNVNTLVHHKSYQLNRVIVCVFMGKHHLALLQTGATVDEIDDVENLHVHTDSSEEESIMEATVIGVQAFHKNFSCMNCKKGVNPTNDSIRIRTSCNTTRCIFIKCGRELSNRCKEKHFPFQVVLRWCLQVMEFPSHFLLFYIQTWLEMADYYIWKLSQYNTVFSPEHQWCNDIATRKLRQPRDSYE